jgi:nucleotide-binding universal stress UspA family protein
LKNILLLIHDDAGQEARYQAALDVCRMIDGHITCLGLRIIPEFVGDYIGTTGILLAEEQGSEAANKARMMARLESEGVPFDWIDRTGFLKQTIQDHAGLSDIIVLSSDAGGTLFPHMADVTGDLLVGLGKPVLVVPPDVRSVNLCGRTMIAWDGSEDAEAALGAAIPLLGQAETVTLYHATDGSLRLPAEEAARYLSRHGIEPVIEQEPAGSDRPGDMILAQVAKGHHDLVIMGAYSRSRLIETIFGGATRTMLRNSPVPVFLAHRR